MRPIDADELITKVTRLRDLAKKREEDTPVNSPCYRTYVAQANERHGFIGMINDAPTVELSPVLNMKPLTAEEKQGLIDALKKSRLKVVKLDDIEGIRGEWARHDEWVNGEYVGGFYHVNCPVIEEGYALYSRWETRFCPNCGAPMLKGGDDA